MNIKHFKGILMGRNEKNASKLLIDVSDMEVTSRTANSIEFQLVDESGAMAQYALSNGLAVDANAVNRLYELLESKETMASEGAIKSLASIHQSFAKTVYPATPRSIALLAQEQARKPLLYFLGPVPLIRRLSTVAIFFLVLLIATSLQKDVNVDNVRLGLLNSDNSILFLNQVFLLCAAGLGASFSALFLANSFIAKATYDPRYDFSYWSSIILGIIAGIILVELLPGSLFDEGAMKNFGKPSLAMLAGFSSKVVYRILQRMVDSLETLVKGNNTSVMEHQKTILQIQSSEQKTQVNAQAASRLVNLISDIDDLDAKTIKQKLNGFVEELLPNRDRM